MEVHPTGRVVRDESVSETCGVPGEYPRQSSGRYTL